MLSLALPVVATAVGWAQTDARRSPYVPPALPAARPPAASMAAPTMPGEPVDFGSMIRLAATSNLDIARARSVVEMAQAERQRALAQALPNLSMGTTYLSHEGRIQ